MRGFAGSPGAHADAIALTDPVVLVVVVEAMLIWWK